MILVYRYHIRKQEWLSNIWVVKSPWHVPEAQLDCAWSFRHQRQLESKLCFEDKQPFLKPAWYILGKALLPQPLVTLASTDLINTIFIWSSLSCMFLLTLFFFFWHLVDHFYLPLPFSLVFYSRYHLHVAFLCTGPLPMYPWASMSGFCLPYFLPPLSSIPLSKLSP